MLWLCTISHKVGCFAGTFATLIPLYFRHSNCFLARRPLMTPWQVFLLTDDDILAIKSSGIFELSPHLVSLPVRAGVFFYCFMISGIDWPLHKLNKSRNATVNIFIFLFLFYLFISIDFDSRESFSRINIFHNYTVFHYIGMLSNSIMSLGSTDQSCKFLYLNSQWCSNVKEVWRKHLILCYLDVPSSTGIKSVCLCSLSVQLCDLSYEPPLHSIVSFSPCMFPLVFNLLFQRF